MTLANEWFTLKPALCALEELTARVFHALVDILAAP